MKKIIILVLATAVLYLLYDKFSREGLVDASDGISVTSSLWGGGDSGDATPENISLEKMKHPETMTEEEWKLAEEWEGVKPQYATTLDQIKTAYARKAVPAYRFNAGHSKKAQRAIRDLENAINSDDFLVVSERCDAATDALRLFEASCRLKPGYRLLITENGPVAVLSCKNCQGTGSLAQEALCPNCNGRGRVPKTIMGSLRESFMAGLEGRRVYNSSPDVLCSSCNGTGHIMHPVPCPSCNGQGNIYQ